VILAAADAVTHPSTNRARRRATLLIRPTTLPLRAIAPPIAIAVTEDQLRFVTGRNIRANVGGDFRPNVQIGLRLLTRVNMIRFSVSLRVSRVRIMFRAVRHTGGTPHVWPKVPTANVHSSEFRACTR